MTRPNALFFSLFLGATMTATSLSAAERRPAPGSVDMAQEYENVKRIAMRDAKVREAFARANERLEARMIEIDPSLAPYIRNRGSAPVRTSLPARAGAPAPAPAARSQRAENRPRPTQPAARPAGRHTVHVVAPGETLGSIAARYRVSTASLQKANGISDPRRLQAGQRLTVPGASAPVVQASARAESRPASRPVQKEEPGFWDRVKSAF